MRGWWLFWSLLSQALLTSLGMVSSWVLAGGLASRPATRGVVKQKETFTNVPLQTKTNIQTFKKKKVTIKRREFLSGCRSARSHFTASPPWQKPATGCVSGTESWRHWPLHVLSGRFYCRSNTTSPSPGTASTFHTQLSRSNNQTHIYILTLHMFIWTIQVLAAGLYIKFIKFLGAYSTSHQVRCRSH